MSLHIFFSERAGKIESCAQILGSIFELEKLLIFFLFLKKPEWRDLSLLLLFFPFLWPLANQLTALKMVSFFLKQHRKKIILLLLFKLPHFPPSIQQVKKRKRVEKVFFFGKISA